MTQDIINAVRNTLSNCENTKANHDKLSDVFQSEDFAREVKALESKVWECPQHAWTFQYMKMFERLHTFTQSTRNHNWLLHLSALDNICIDICSMDRIKYRRLLPVYIAEMHGLKYTVPQVWDAFKKGGFVVEKSHIPFTAIGVDHSGEQVNKILKINGGLVGISHNVNARDRFFLTAPYIAEITKEMKIAGNLADKSRKKHHQLSPSIQAKRYEQVINLRDVFYNHGITFDTHVEIDGESIIPTVKFASNVVYREMPSAKIQESLQPSGIHNIITNEEV